MNCASDVAHSRDKIDDLKKRLKELGATQVLTYDDLAQKETRGLVKEWTGGKVNSAWNRRIAAMGKLIRDTQQIRLGLNCVSGKETTLMARYLGSNAHLVSYGAMSKQPLSIPTSLFIFKNLTCQGFWQSQWYGKRSREDRERLVLELAKLMTTGRVRLYTLTVA